MDDIGWAVVEGGWELRVSRHKRGVVGSIGRHRFIRTAWQARCTYALLASRAS